MLYLCQYCVTGMELSFFTSYLFCRVQYVKFSDVCSEKLLIGTAVPQGSVLAALLFSIYINDFPTIGTIFKMLMCFEDTTFVL